MSALNAACYPTAITRRILSPLASNVLIMSHAKRHHYVPAAYLARFGEDEYVQVRRRGEARMYSPHVKNVAVESGFYEVVDANGEPSDVVEKNLSGLEGDAISALTGLDRTEQPPSAASDERSVLASYLAVQLTRTPLHRERFMFPERVAQYAGAREVDADLMAEYLEKVHLGFEPADREVQGALHVVQYVLKDRAIFTKDNAIRVAFRDINRLRAILLGMHWSLEISRKPRLITSDAPLVLWRKPRAEDEYKGFGLLDAEEVRFPTSPEMQLVLTPRPREPRARIDPKRAAACNAEVALTCYRAIVGHPQRSEQLQRLDLPARRSVIRFDEGPGYRTNSNGSAEPMGDVIHMWVPRR